MESLSNCDPSLSVLIAAVIRSFQKAANFLLFVAVFTYPLGLTSHPLSDPLSSDTEKQILLPSYLGGSYIFLVASFQLKWSLCSSQRLLA